MAANFVESNLIPAYRVTTNRIQNSIFIVEFKGSVSFEFSMFQHAKTFRIIGIF